MENIDFISVSNLRTLYICLCFYFLASTYSCSQTLQLHIVDQYNDKVIACKAYDSSSIIDQYKKVDMTQILKFNKSACEHHDTHTKYHIISSFMATEYFLSDNL